MTIIQTRQLNMGCEKNLPYFLLNLLQIIKPFTRPPQGIAISIH